MGILKFTNPLYDLTNKYDSIFKRYRELLKANSHFPEFESNLNFLVTRIFDLESFSEFYFRYGIPAAKKSTKDFRRGIAQAGLETQEYVTEEFFDNRLQEFLKLGYIELYHKYERFRNDLLKQLGYHKKKDKDPFLKYCEEKYGWRLFDASNHTENLKEILWICDQSKHYGPLQTKDKNTPLKFILTGEKIIKITEHDLRQHVEFMKEHFLILLRTLILIKARMGIDEHSDLKVIAKHMDNQIKLNVLLLT